MFAHRAAGQHSGSAATDRPTHISTDVIRYSAWQLWVQRRKKDLSRDWRNPLGYEQRTHDKSYWLHKGVFLAFISPNLLKPSNRKRIQKPLAHSYFKSNQESEPVAETPGILAEILSPEVKLKRSLLLSSNTSSDRHKSYSRWILTLVFWQCWKWMNFNPAEPLLQWSQ